MICDLCKLLSIQHKIQPSQLGPQNASTTLRNAKYPFIAITPKSTMAQSGSTS